MYNINQPLSMFYLGINFVLGGSNFLLTVNNNIGEKREAFCEVIFLFMLKRAMVILLRKSHSLSVSDSKTAHEVICQNLKPIIVHFFFKISRLSNISSTNDVVSPADFTVASNDFWSVCLVGSIHPLVMPPITIPALAKLAVEKNSSLKYHI